MNNILHGPALDQLKTLDSESVDCCITSPPYWALRDYKSPPQIWDTVNGCAHEWNNETKKWHSDRGDNKHKEVFDRSFAWKGTEHAFCSKCNAWKGSLGLEPTFQLYIKHLIEIFDQVRRVLKKSGACWVNMGDTYSSTSRGDNRKPEDFKEKNTLGRVGVNNQCFNTDNIPKMQSSHEVPEKSLCLIPQRFAIAMVDEGWICRNTIIWFKPNCMPSSAKDRFTVDFEYLFFFTKSQKYYFETQYESIDKDTPRKYESGFTFPRAWTNEQIPFRKSAGTINWQLSPLGRIKRCVWKIPTQPFSEAHFAVFPPALVKTPLLATCPPNGLVLDPFLGSGTVALVALQNARNFIGIELNQSYIDMSLKRLEPYLLQTRLQLG